MSAQQQQSVRGWHTYSMYGGKVVVGFDEFGKRTGKRHTYWLKVPKSAQYPQGRRLIPGVTGISGLLTEAASGLSPWAARMAIKSLEDAGHKFTEDEIFEAARAHTTQRDFAAVRGTIVHRFIEQRVKGEKIDAKPEHKLHLKYADSVMRKLASEKMRVIACEIKIFSRINCFAGTLDLVVERADGTRAILDVKTSRAFRIAHAMQIAAYAGALEEEFPNKPAFDDAGVILAAATSKIEWLSEAAELPGRRALAQFYNAFLGLLAVKTSIPNIRDFGRKY